MHFVLHLFVQGLSRRVGGVFADQAETARSGEGDFLPRGAFRINFLKSDHGPVLQSSPDPSRRRPALVNRLWSVVPDGVFGAFPGAPLDLVAQHVDLLAHDLPEQSRVPGVWGTVDISHVSLRCRSTITRRARDEGFPGGGRSQSLS